MPDELLRHLLVKAYTWSHVALLLSALLFVALTLRWRLKRAVIRPCAGQRSDNPLKTGQDVARLVLKEGGAAGVPVLSATGALGTLWVPGRRELRLLEGVATGTSAGAFAAAAHEAGIALLGQGPLGWVVTLRFWAVVFCGLGNSVAWLAVFSGMLVGYPGLSMAGTLLLLGILGVGIALLPLERAGCRRAVQALSNGCLSADVLSSREFQGAIAASVWDPIIGSLVPLGQVPASSRWW